MGVGVEEMISSVKRRKGESPMLMAGHVDTITCSDMLIDTGATASFVRRGWAAKCRLPVERLRGEVSVTVADRGKTSVCDGVAVGRLVVNGSAAACTLLVMDDLTNDVIVGLDWLRAARVTIGLGPTIQWNGVPVVVGERLQANASKQLAANSTTPTSAAGSETVAATVRLSAPTVAVRQQKEREFLESYRDVFSEQLPIKTDEQRKRAAQFKVELYDPGCRPVKQRERKMTPMKIQAAKEWVRTEVAAGRMEPSSSEWSSQLVFVKKDDSATTPLRPCGDYIPLNDRTKKDAYRLPLMEQLIDSVGEWKARVFSKLDATKGFNQIPVHPDSRHLLAISTPDGLYQPTVMPFGVTNAPSVFQREMERVLARLQDEGVRVFVDDVLLFTTTLDEHERLLERVLGRMRSEGYALHPKKCELFRDEVVFLGHRISAEGVAVQQRKIEAVRDWPAPRTQTEVRSFLGFANFYHKFVNGYAHIARPLTVLTGKGAGWQWTSEQQHAFERLRDALCSSEVLVHADPSKQYILQCDASDYAVGASLSQRHDPPEGVKSKPIERPIAYYSHMLDVAQCNYSPTEKELLAIVLAAEHWENYLQGHHLPIIIRTDHQPLTWLNNKPQLTPRLSRWVMRLADYYFMIEYVKGKDNHVADALSRRPDLVEQAKANRAATAGDEQGQRVRLAAVTTRRGGKSQQPSSVEQQSASDVKDDEAEEKDEGGQLTISIGDMLEDIRVAGSRDEQYIELLKASSVSDGLERRDGVVYSADGKVWIPNDRQLRTRILQLAHDWSGHFAARRTLEKVARHCRWERMAVEVEDYCRSCPSCAAQKGSNQKTPGLLRPLPIPVQAWDSIGLDFVGPLPRTKSGNDQFMTIVDRLTKMVVLAACKVTITGKQAGVLVVDRLLPLAAKPTSIVSDRDPRFTGSCWSQMWARMGASLDMSTAYHPQTNGQTERTNRTIQTILRTLVKQRGGEWEDWLQIAAAAYNSTVHESTGKTPFELNFMDRRAIDPLEWAVAQRLRGRKKEGENNNDDARRLLADYTAMWAEVKTRLQQEQAKREKYANQQRRPVTYRVGDRVMLSSENIRAKAGKFKDKWLGPYSVTRVANNGGAVTLDLPADLRRLYPTITVSRVKPYVLSRYDWPGRQQIEGTGVELEDEEDGDVYEVEAIIGKNIEEHTEYVERVQVGPGRTVNGRQLRATKMKVKVPVVSHVVKYLVKWKGYDESEAQWKSIDKLDDCRELVDAYEELQRRPADDAQDSESTLALAYNMRCVMPTDKTSSRHAYCQLMRVA